MARRNTSDFLDIKTLLRQWLSKWYLFVISVAVCGSLAFFYTKIKHPEYAVRANVLITQDNSSSIPDPTGGALSALFGSDAYVEDEIFLVSSHSLYRDVARDLGLNAEHYVELGFLNEILSYPEFPVTVWAPQSMVDTLTVSSKFYVNIDKNGKADIKVKQRKQMVAKVKDVDLPYTIDTPVGAFTVSTTQYYTPGENLTTKIFFSGYDSAAEDLDRDVSAEIASKRSNVISLGINTTNPEYGEAILNEILVKYNSRGIVEKRNQSELTARFIDDRLGVLAAELAVSDRELQDYKQKKGIINIAYEAKYQTERKAAVEEKLLEAQTREEMTALTGRFLSNPENAYAMIPMIVEGDGLQGAIAQYNEKIIERNNLATSARPDNSALRLLSDGIDQMRENIQLSLRRSLETQQIAVRDLKRELDATDRSLTDIPQTEREYIDLERNHRVKQELYILLLQKREENALIMANALPKGQIIDEAYTMSDPLGMGKKAILLIGLLLGLCLPPLYLYCRKLIHNRFETRQDVERMTDVPILGEMCIDNSGHRLVVSSDNTSSSAELFRLMRSNLLFVLNDPRDKVVLLTSTSSGEGKSFISINLAASLALLNKRVLLVGMDIRNPRLAEYLGINPRFGLTQYLSSSSITLDQLISPLDGVPGLDVICAGPVPPNPAELLISPKVDELFTELRSRYDYVIVDTAPIGLVSDTFTLDRIADASIYVCRANYTSLSDLAMINDIFDQHRLKKVSLVINGTAAKKTYGYGKKK